MIARGVTGSMLVLLGGLVVSPLPDTARLLHLEVLVELRSTMPGRMLGLAVVMTGIGLLAAAWLSLCRTVARVENDGRSVPVGDRRTTSLGLVHRATLAWSAPLMLAPPLFSRDGWSYAAQGMLTSLDVSPYDHGPAVLRGPIVEAVDPRWMDTPTPYGPLPLILGDLSARLTTDPWVLVIMHRGVAVAGLVLLAWAIPRMARWAGTNPALAAGVVIASPLMLANGVGGLHNDLLMVGLMAAALVVAAERGWQWAAVLGGAAAAVKLPGGLVCVAVVLVSLPLTASLWERVRRLASVGALALGTLWGLGAIWGLGTGWVDALTVPGTVNTPLSMPTVVGQFLDRLVALLGIGIGDTFFLDAIRALASVATVAVVVWVALRWRTGERNEAVRALVVIISVMLLLSPVVHLWYFLWLVPFVAPMRMSRLGTTFLVAVCLIGGAVAPLDPSLRGAYLTIVVGSLGAALIVAALLFTRRSRERLERIADSDWLAVR